FYPFIEGFSQRKYTQKELDEINNKTVELNGKEISQYEASQIQRSLERNIRKYKRQASALESAGLDNTAELSNVRKYQAELRTFVKETGLQRQNVRERI
ncbi:MAG: phage minor capsid protein, partial [Methanobacterium sp.]